MHDAAGSTVSYDGRTHLLTAADESWRVCLELEQLGDGEVIGVGSLWTAASGSRVAEDVDVIVSGRVDERGVAVVTLHPVPTGRRAPATLVVRVLGRTDVQDPVVSEVIAVRGLPS